MVKHNFGIQQRSNIANALNQFSMIYVRLEYSFEDFALRLDNQPVVIPFKIDLLDFLALNIPM